MNVERICSYLSPLLSQKYVAVRPARKVEPDIEDRDAQLPLCLVHPWKEVAGQNRYDNFVSQSVAERFAVITICPIELLEPAREALFRALLGKVLPEYTYEINYTEGETLDIDASVIWWRDIFTTHRDRRQT